MDRREFCLTAAALLCLTDSAHADPKFRILLLYPKWPQPQRSVVDLILASFLTEARVLGLSVLEQEVLPVTSREKLLALVKSTRPDALAILGSEIIALVASLPLTIPVLATAAQLPSPDGRLGGISLVVDPARIFSCLKKIAPSIQRVSVVIDSHRFGWLTDAMQRAAKKLSLTLQLHETDSIGAAAAQYSIILGQANRETDSIWLLNQPEFLTPDVLPRIIEDAWGREVLTFSNVLEHVSEGALFGTYLDPKSLGRRFAQLTALAQGKRPPLLLDENPAFAVNVRTARHLARIVDMNALDDFSLRLDAS